MKLAPEELAIGYLDSIPETVYSTAGISQCCSLTSADG